jgi:hypothetical protein
MRYSGALGTLIYEKNLMSKISCQTPFKTEVLSSVPHITRVITTIEHILLVNFRLTDMKIERFAPLF